MNRLRKIWAGIAVVTTMLVGLHDGWTWNTAAWALEVIVIGQTDLPAISRRLSGRLQRNPLPSKPLSVMLVTALNAMCGSAIVLGAPVGLCIGVVLPIVYRLNITSHLSGLLGLLIGPFVAAFYGLASVLIVCLMMWTVSIIKSVFRGVYSRSQYEQEENSCRDS